MQYAGEYFVLLCAYVFVSVSDPPDATISSATQNWYVGLEKAELVCNSGGYPKPQNVTWKWYRQQPVCCSYIQYLRFISVWL